MNVYFIVSMVFCLSALIAVGYKLFFIHCGPKTEESFYKRYPEYAIFVTQISDKIGPPVFGLKYGKNCSFLWEVIKPTRSILSFPKNIELYLEERKFYIKTSSSGPFWNYKYPVSEQNIKIALNWIEE